MSVESILQQMAQNSGRAKLQRGAMLANTIANVSNVPGQILNDRDQQRIFEAQQARQRAGDARLAQHDARQAKQDLSAEEKAAREEADKALILSAVKVGFNGQADRAKFDEQAAGQVLVEAGRPDLIDIATAPYKKHVAKPTILGEGQKAFDENNQPIEGMENPKPAPAAPKVTFQAPITAMVNGQRTLIRTGSDGLTYDMRGKPLDGSVVLPEPKEAKEPREPKVDDLVQAQGPDGSTIWVPKKDAAGMKAAQPARGVTGAERQTLAFYNRAADAVKTLTDGGDASLEMKMAKQGLVGQGQLGYEGFGSNYLKSEDQQQYRQAQRAFTEARLRKESGAAIPESEFTNDRKTYFVQPGDSEKMVAQKKASRQALLDGLKFSSGRAYDEFYGEPNLSPAKAAGAAPKATGRFNPATGKVDPIK